jgi:DNA recombination protein RmuC
MLIIGTIFQVLIFFTLTFLIYKFRSADKGDQRELISKDVEGSLFNFNEKMQHYFNGRFERFGDKLDDKLDRIEDKMNDKLDKSMKSSNDTFEKIIERLSRIDQAQKQMEQIGNSVISLKEILSDKKSRGAMGEIQLYQIAYSVFGENKGIYQKQYKMSNGTIVDMVLFMPPPSGTICVDSKFPLENYRRAYDETITEENRAQAFSQFKKDIKKHIDDIAKKYIIEGETSDQAIMFIPAESVFSEIHANHPDVLEYSYKNKVWITSPTTLMAMLTTVEVVLSNIERSKYADIIQDEIKKLSKEFERYSQRWSKLSQHIETVQKDVKEIHITTDKIADRFNQINNVEIKTKSLT